MAKKKAATQAAAKKKAATKKAAPRRASAKKAAAKKKAAKEPVVLPKKRPPRSADSMTPEQYGRHKARTGAAQRKQSADGRDIRERDEETGEWIPLPAPADPERRELCCDQLHAFLLQYFPDLFALEMSPDHLELIQSIEHNVLHGGLEAFALPRGSGKTTISECSAIWALVYGHRRFLALIGATEGAAKESLNAIKVAFETNDILLADFPEVCIPIVKLEGIVNRCRGQSHNGERTRMVWKDDAIVLPTIEGSVASGSCIKSRGITGRIRGMKHALADGTSIRPDFVMIDDPQTEESAASEKENAKRIKVLKKAILGLAGPGKRIAGIMPCTVIEPGDMADMILDRERYPEWNGRRIPGLKSFPTNLRLWEQYQELREEDYRNGDKTTARATAFYQKNRSEMDAGGEAYWQARFDPGELSALQNLMNWFLRDPEGFAAEVQQQPERTDQDDTDLLTVEEITQKQHAQAKDVVPMVADRITSMIDVGEKLLWYTVAAWDQRFSGFVLRYGTWPDQGTLKFNKLKPKVTLVDYYSRGKTKLSIDAATRRGLEDLTDMLLGGKESNGLQFAHESGVEMQIQRLLIDGGDRDTLIKTFVRERQNPRVWVSFGRTPKVGGNKLHEAPKKDSQITGEYWRSRVDPIGKVRFVVFDTNYWKSFMHRGLSTTCGERGSISLFAQQPHRHEKFASHLRAETRRRLEVNGERADFWDGGGENDWFDTLVGCTVAASIEHCTHFGEAAPKKTGRGMKLSELRNQRRAA